MKIAIDLSQIIYGTGVSHYRENLVRNLLKIDSENEYVLYAGSLRRKQDILNFFPQTKVFPIPPRLADLIWNRLHIFPIEKIIGDVDLIHTSDWAEPPSKKNKVTTIHDLVALKFSKITPKIIVETHKHRLKWILKESKRIIVPSIATKNDLLELGFKENNIRVIYEAPNLGKATGDEVLEVKKKYSIREDYLIAIGVNPRKNIKGIVDAYHLSKFGKNLKLIIVGEKINTKLEDERGVRFLGHVSDFDLKALLTGSKALIFPSLYEGFGVPILDAFNCEVPVVTSNISSMPEVAGGAAILVDPYDINSIASGIEEAISKPKTLIAKGLKRVSEFSWTKTAEETLKVYKEII
ncbi:MAG: glycosyltransferase family 1 protein [Candidatus Woesebacteria bacterium]|nr:glycosyltransferase family 1 protein [Candidatus Woesebacteria bacterium]